jgi:hypothetical protein
MHLISWICPRGNETVMVDVLVMILNQGTVILTNIVKISMFCIFGLEKDF